LTVFLDAFFHRNLVEVKPLRLKKLRRNLRPVSMRIDGTSGFFEMKDVLSNSMVTMDIHEIEDIKLTG
jgi:hypothetical protein